MWARWPGTDQNGAYRVVAVGPATVMLDGSGVVHVNGEPIPQTDRDGLRYERWGNRDIPVIPGGPTQERTSVPDSHLFLLSDARPVGGDGRVHGVIGDGEVLGTLGFIHPL
ncbi:MAG: hypothetical protein CL927_20070 [Deltaproteobacteria bacterium]|nr:hypothetical protein [Deltaproteobacteria bacterium]HCH66836.1 hypothetical protein [Deltaproteobacteria bacterium]